MHCHIRIRTHQMEIGQPGRLYYHRMTNKNVLEELIAYFFFDKTRTAEKAKKLGGGYTRNKIIL